MGKWESGKSSGKVGKWLRFLVGRSRFTHGWDHGCVRSLKGHVSIKKTCAWNVILFIMAAPKVGKWESGKVGKWERSFPGSGKRGENVVASHQDAYSEYYDFVVDVCEIGVESFATLLKLCWLTTCEHYGNGIANWFGRRHGDKCALPIVWMLDATTTWELKCPGAISRSFYLQTAHGGSSLARSATTSRPL